MFARPEGWPATTAEGEGPLTGTTAAAGRSSTFAGGINTWHTGYIAGATAILVRRPTGSIGPCSSTATTPPTARRPDRIDRPEGARGRRRGDKSGRTRTCLGRSPPDPADPGKKEDPQITQRTQISKNRLPAGVLLALVFICIFNLCPLCNLRIFFRLGHCATSVHFPG